ncbi:MAG TPA: DUF4271 domain-containing protein [Chitinophagaceae bacterium]
MTRFSILLICCLFFFIPGLFAQQDSTAVIDTTKPVIPDTVASQTPVVDLSDSFSKKPVVADSGWQVDKSMPLIYQVMKGNPYYGFGTRPTVIPVSDLKVFNGKELLFYVLIALLLVFALIKQAFPKYFTDLFRLFFRTTLKQRQVREQLMQTPLPSLLMNGFFVICTSLYATFLFLHFRLIDEADFWLYFLYSCLGLSAIYFVKFVGLKITGWIFGIEEAANAYIFIVFIINKVIGVFLLPFLLLLAFLTSGGYQAALVLSWIGVGGLFLYRFILSYSAVHNQVRFNLFHFFLYLCAFEIAPLLLIYKLLLVVFQ